MHEDLGPCLLSYLRAALRCPRADFAEPLQPLSGGFDTAIFAFRLRGVMPALCGPLILRVLGRHHDPVRALRESAIQNALAGMGFPAPRAPLASADTGILGGAFVVMERRPGRPLLAERPLGMATLLVETHLRLHALDPAVLLDSVEREVPGSRAALSLDGHFDQLTARIDRHGLDGLASAMRWLGDHRPSLERHAICHGDFHPQNLLAEGRAITAVLDWPNALIADPAYDVASTRVILGLTPLGILPVRRSLRLVVGVGRRLLLARYLHGYGRRRPLDAKALAYYEALACMRGMVRAAESRAGGRGPASPLDASGFGDALATRFAALTGVRPNLEARRGGPGG